MLELIPPIRNAARALIIRQDNILLLRKQGGGRGERFALPGGSQDPGESLTDALDRECREEIGTKVLSAELVFIADFIKLRDTQPPTTRHIVDFLFRCRVPDDYTPQNGEKPDKHQVNVMWVALSDIHLKALSPYYLPDCISGMTDSDGAVYLGKFDDRSDR